MEQAHAQGLLELVDAARERGLREVKLLGGGAEAAEADHGHEGAQVGEIEIHAWRASIMSEIAIYILP